jgi:endonuclease/exonuclease/phosphatase family metal-dependent hydrolase
MDLRIRPARRGALLAHMAFIALLALGACAPLPSGDAGTAAVATLMSFNIRTSGADDGENGWAYRAEGVARLVASRDPDIIGFQEAQPDQVAFLAERLPAYAYIARSRDADPGAGEAIPLFFHAGRWALDAEEHGTFWLSDTPELPASKSWGNNFPRIVTWARLVHRQSGRALYVYNLHLDHESGNARARSAELVLRRVTSRHHADPVVVLGDFNAEPGSAVLQTLEGGEPGLRDSYTPKGSGDGTFHAFSGERNGPRIDYILVAANLEVLDACVIHEMAGGGAYPSDHFPVQALLRF